MTWVAPAKGEADTKGHEMHIGLWIKGKKYEFNGDIGWYRSNDFVALNAQIFEFSDGKLSTIFHVQIAKFVVGLYINNIF